jgi:hypothetical protein
VSERWLVLRARARTERIVTVRLRDGRTRRVQDARRAALGRPALDGELLVFGIASAARSTLEQVDLRSRARRTLRSASRAQLTQPSILGDELLYVATDRTGQHLRLGRRRAESGRRDRSLLRVAPQIQADRGVEPGGDAHGTTSPHPRPEPATGPATTLWTTALAADAAYVTRLVARPGGVTSELLRVAR